MILAPSDRNSHSLWSSSTQRLLRPCLGALRWCDGGRVVARKVLQFSRACAFMFEKICSWTRKHAGDLMFGRQIECKSTNDIDDEGLFPSDWTYLQNYKTYHCCDANDIPQNAWHLLVLNMIFSNVMNLVARSVRFEDHDDDALDRMGLPWATNLKSVKALSPKYRNFKRSRKCSACWVLLKGLLIERQKTCPSVFGVLSQVVRLHVGHEKRLRIDVMQRIRILYTVLQIRVSLRILWNSF